MWIIILKQLQFEKPLQFMQVLICTSLYCHQFHKYKMV